MFPLVDPTMLGVLGPQSRKIAVILTTTELGTPRKNDLRSTTISWETPYALHRRYNLRWFSAFIIVGHLNPLGLRLLLVSKWRDTSLPVAVFVFSTLRITISTPRLLTESYYLSRWLWPCWLLCIWRMSASDLLFTFDPSFTQRTLMRASKIPI